MHDGQLVFAQLMDFLPRHEFNKCVRRYRGNSRNRGFSCFDQFFCMAFAQLSFIHNFIIFWAEGEPGGGEVGHAAESDP